MWASIRVAAVAVSLFGMVVAQAQATSYGILVGVDYAKENQKWAKDAVDLFNALSPLPNWNLTLLTGNAVTPNGILNAINLVTPQVTANDGLLFYYSGHGSYFTDAGDLERLPPAGKAADIVDETLWLAQNLALGDDTLTAALGVLPGKTNLLVFLDSCFGGGFWNGSDRGDLERLPSTTLIAAADETNTAPGTSQISKNFVAYINDKGLDLDAPGGSTNLDAMYGKIKTAGGTQANRKGDPAISPEQYNPLDFVSPETTGGSVFYTNEVPEPSSFALVAAGLALAALRLRHKKP